MAGRDLKSELYLLRALFWSVFLSVILDRHRLRGRGQPRVKLSRIIGYTALISAVIWSFESSSLEEGSKDALRGGGAAREKTKLPTFRVIKYDDSRHRMTLNQVREEFKEPQRYTIKHKRDKITDMTLSEIETWRKREIGTYGDWKVKDRYGVWMPLSRRQVDRLGKVYEEIKSNPVIFEDDEPKTSLSPSGLMKIHCEKGPKTLSDLAFHHWMEVIHYMRNNITIQYQNEDPDIYTVQQLKNLAKYLFAEERIYIKLDADSDFVMLSRKIFNDLKKEENQMEIIFEELEFLVDHDFFIFMDMRIKQKRDANTNSVPPLRAWGRFKAPPGFDPLKTDRDGLFLVTPRMERIEAERPIFVLSFNHIGGYCYNGTTYRGKKCSDERLDTTKEWSLHGLGEFVEELDHALPPHPDTVRDYEALESWCVLKPQCQEYLTAVERHVAPLHEDYAVNLHRSYLHSGRFLQMYDEVRGFTGWLKKTHEIVGSMPIEAEMKKFKTAHDTNGAPVKAIRRKDLHGFLSKEGASKPMLSCRKSPHELEPPLPILTGMSVCLTRDFRPVDCKREDPCKDEFYVASKEIQ